MGKYTVEKDVRALIQTSYLNLAMCFLKLGEEPKYIDGPNPKEPTPEDIPKFDESYLIHALNSSTRALIGDLEPPDPAHSKVLTNDQKVKALFRKASAGTKLLEIEMGRELGEIEKRVTDEGQVGYKKLAKYTEPS